MTLQHDYILTECLSHVYTLRQNPGEKAIEAK